MGTLNVAGAVSQITATTLTGGTWSVTGTTNTEAELSLGSKKFTTLGVAASVSLSGPNSAITNLGGLTTVKGSLSLLNGQSLTNATAFTNAGAITLSPGSTLSVKAFTQTPSAKLTVQIGGTNASPVIGGIVATGPITLAGTLSVTDPGGVKPPIGAALTIIRNQGTAPVNGVFAGLPNGAKITVNGMTFTISYKKGTFGRDVVLTRTS